MKIEFDPRKRQETLPHRGLDMTDADLVFAGNTLTIVDERRDYGEERFITVGKLRGRMVVFVWTPRKSSRQIICMRKANDRERKLYEERLA